MKANGDVVVVVLKINASGLKRLSKAKPNNYQKIKSGRKLIKLSIQRQECFHEIANARIITVIFVQPQQIQSDEHRFKTVINSAMANFA